MQCHAYIPSSRTKSLCAEARSNHTGPRVVFPQPAAQLKQVLQQCPIIHDLPHFPHDFRCAQVCLFQFGGMSTHCFLVFIRVVALLIAVALLIVVALLITVVLSIRAFSRFWFAPSAVWIAAFTALSSPVPSDFRSSSFASVESSRVGQCCLCPASFIFAAIKKRSFATACGEIAGAQESGVTR